MVEWNFFNCERIWVRVGGRKGSCDFPLVSPPCFSNLFWSFSLSPLRPLPSATISFFLAPSHSRTVAKNRPSVWIERQITGCKFKIKTWPRKSYSVNELLRIYLHKAFTKLIFHTGAWPETLKCKVQAEITSFDIKVKTRQSVKPIKTACHWFYWTLIQLWQWNEASGCIRGVLWRTLFISASFI